ncbi:MAG TPA: hypothetical protein VLU47_03495 [Blastocatellia bacterium]|nr:hypothetical protein [Blastocatellia bacterium]
MSRKTLSAMLGLVLASVTVCGESAAGANKLSDQAGHIRKVRTSVLKLGVGRDARVQLRLRDKTRLSGFISEVGEDSLVIESETTGAVTAVAYPNVTQVKGHNLSTGAKIGIGIAIGFAVTALIIFASH